MDTAQRIFDSLRADYDGFDSWLDRVRHDSDNRACLVIRHEESYAAIALLKIEEPCPFPFPGPIVKISTFKVGVDHAGVKYGELLLKAVLADANTTRCRSLYVEVFPRHQQLVDFFMDFGFCDSTQRTSRGELVLVKTFVPGAEAGALSDLDFHIRYGPPAVRLNQSAYVVPIEPRWHDQLFPEKAPPGAADRQLPLFEDGETPLTHPWGNALRKAYLCNSPLTTIKAGDVLLFYRSKVRRAVTAIGVVEDVLRSADPAEITTFVGRRTVYTPTEIAGMCRSVRGVLALRFRQDRFIEPPWQLTELRLAHVLRSWPQTIVTVSGEGIAWVRARLGE